MGKRNSYALLILAAVCATYFFENFLRQAPSALTPILIDDLGITHGMAGLLISAYFFLYAFMQLPSGVLSDALGPRKTIIGFTVFTVLGTGLFNFASDVNTLLAAQLLIGLGSSVLYINAVRIVSNWFPAERKASAIGVLSAASGLGNFAAYIGFPLTISLFGSWKALYLVCSGLLVINFVINLLFLRNSPDGVDSWENGGSSF
jgi:MFS family permease